MSIKCQMGGATYSSCSEKCDNNSLGKINLYPLRSILVFKSYGLFYRLNGTDAIIMYYLFDLPMKKYFVYIPKNNINKYTSVLDKIGIDYYINGFYHQIEINNYFKYYEMTFNKMKLKEFIGDLNGR